MNWLKRKKKTEFEFSTQEIVAIGDYYKYTVKAESKEEAFKKLVEYFYGDKSSEDIVTKSGTISSPSRNLFEYKGMPMWFAKIISGVTQDSSGKHRQTLERYCKYNNIVIKK